MTTVAALAVRGTVWMAADTMTNVYDRPVPGAARKIMRLEAQGVPLLVGISGNAGMTGRIRAAWNPDDVAAPPLGDGYRLQEWAEAVSTLLTQPVVDAGMTDADGQMDGHFLLAAAGSIWTIFHHAAVPHADGRATVGSGEGVALGALDAVLGSVDDPETALRYAVEIACVRDRWSGLPLQVEVLRPAV